MSVEECNFYNEYLRKNNIVDKEVLEVIREADSRTHNIVKVRCLKCGNIYNKELRELKKTPCRVCVPISPKINNIKHMTDKLKESIEEKVLNECVRRNFKCYTKVFNGIETRLELECENNHRISISAHSFLSGTGCKQCFNMVRGRKRYIEYDKHFREKLEKELGDTYEVIEVGKRAHDKCLIRCKNCGMLWRPNMTDVYYNHAGCMCRVVRYCRSNSEEKIAQFVEGLGFKVIRNYRIPKRGGYEIDIFIPDLRIGIEYNGLYWNSTEYHDKNYHKMKREMCYSEGIRLIQIWEDQFLRNEELIFNKINYVCGYDRSNIINTRKCAVEELSVSEYKEIMKNHIQGGDKPQIRLGLKFDSIIVAAIGLAKPNLSRSSKEQQKLNQLELTRFVTNINYRVPGALSKFMSYIKKNFKADSVYSYADLDLVDKNKNVYVSSGFEEEKECMPDYSYVIKSKREHRYKYRKSKLKKLFSEVYSDEKTEKEMMESMGYYQIWNSGFIKYRYYLK